MRRKLLSGLSEDKPKKFVTQSKDLNSDDDVSDDVSDGVKEELQVNFGIGFGEDIGQKLLKKKQEKKEKKGMSEFQKWQEKRKERRREKKAAQKEKVKVSRKQGAMSEKEVIKMSEDDRRKRAEMDLLLDDNTDVKAVKFDKKVAKSDARFQVEGDNEFAVDPTHKDYRKVVQGHNKVSKRARRS